jgi:acetyl-CoA acetyltransferase
MTSSRSGCRATTSSSCGSGTGASGPSSTSAVIAPALDHDTYAGSRWIAEPLRLFDCSRENDGAAAVLVTTAEQAGDCRPEPAYILSGVQGAGPHWSEPAENDAAYTSAGFHPALVARLWDGAGLNPGGVDVVQVYENFSGPAVASLIDVGLCPPGAEAGRFMTLPNLIAPAGALPVNTAGGNLAGGFVHGIGLVLEAVRVTGHLSSVVSSAAPGCVRQRPGGAAASGPASSGSPCLVRNPPLYLKAIDFRLPL